MENKFEYRKSDYFCVNDNYIFKDWRKFESKVHLHNGSWYTDESLKYKATSILCYKLDDKCPD